MSETLAWFAFEDLPGTLVHDLLQLRQDVFVVEQACAFPEIDGRDPAAIHLLAAWSGDLVGCLRVLSAGGEVRIGRVVVAMRARGTGVGHRMMEAAIQRCRAEYSGQAIALSAQAHLSDFYASHGFIIASPAYLEDGIPHVDMRREA